MRRWGVEDAQQILAHQIERADGEVGRDGGAGIEHARRRIPMAARMHVAHVTLEAVRAAAPSRAEHIGQRLVQHCG